MKGIGAVRPILGLGGQARACYITQHIQPPRIALSENLFETNIRDEFKTKMPFSSILLLGGRGKARLVCILLLFKGKREGQQRWQKDKHRL